MAVMVITAIPHRDFSRKSEHGDHHETVRALPSQKWFRMAWS